MRVCTHSFVCMHAYVSVCVFRCVCASILTLSPVIFGWFVSDAGVHLWLITQCAGNSVILHWLPVGHPWTMCVSVFVCETAWISTLTSCSTCVDVVSMFVHKTAVSEQLCVVYNLAGNPTQLCVSGRTDKLTRKTKEHHSFALLCLSPLTSVGIMG